MAISAALAPVLCVCCRALKTNPLLRVQIMHADCLGTLHNRPPDTLWRETHGGLDQARRCRVLHYQTHRLPALALEASASAHGRHRRQVYKQPVAG